jgi:hypothetical protein
MPHQRRLVLDMPVLVRHFDETKMLFPGRHHRGETLFQLATDLR